MMKKSQEMTVDYTDAKVAEALAMADDFIKDSGISGKDAIRMRLLVEETLGMVRAMADYFSAKFWVELDGKEYRIRLTADTIMNLDKKKELLSVSTTGQNAAVKGFMGKIGEIIENAMLNYNDILQLQQEYGGGCVDYGAMGVGMPSVMAVDARNMAYMWSLKNYREALEAPDANAPEKEAWDELEKSIVASIAKDVTVGVRNEHVDMTILGALA